MINARLSLRRRPIPKPPPPGIVLSEASTDERNFKLASFGTTGNPRPAEPAAEADEDVTLEQREALIKRYEAELAHQQKELKDRQVDIEARNREASERLMLAEKREAILESKEELLETRADDLKDATTIQRLRNLLLNQKTALDDLQNQLKAATERIETLESSTALHSSVETEADTFYDSTLLPKDIVFEPEGSTSIDEEREAYIEASEEALLLKAQQLEELESHLRQWQEELEMKASCA